MKNFDEIKKEAEEKTKIDRALISNKDFYDKELPATKWIAEKLIPCGITILSANPSSYKTWLILKMAIEIAEGKPMFGHFKTAFEEETRKASLIINEESGEKTIQDRIKMLIDEKEKDLPIYYLNLAGIKIETDLDKVLEICKEKGIKFLIIDSLTRIHNKQENSADEVKQIFEGLVKFVKENISVILTHHNRKESMFGKNKNISQEMRGSVDLLAQVDCHLAIDIVDVDRGFITIKQPKLRTAEAVPDFKINIIKDNDKIDFVYGGSFTAQDFAESKTEEAKEVILKIIEDNPEITRDEICDKLRGVIGERIVKMAIPKLEKEGLILSATLKPKKYIIKEQNSGLF